MEHYNHSLSFEKTLNRFKLRESIAYFVDVISQVVLLIFFSHNGY